MTDGLSPDPPHVTIGCYLDQWPDHEALDMACTVLAELGGNPTRRAWIGEESVVFEYVSDLELTLGPWPVTLPSLRPYRVGFTYGALGEVAVTFDPAVPPDRHPVAFHTHADMFGIPQNLWANGERRRAKRYRAAVATLYTSLCERLDPLYAVVNMEDPFPTPRALVKGALVPRDLYVSRRLSGAVPHLLDQLRRELADYSERVIELGTYYSMWLMVRDSFPPTLQESVARASELLGKALAKLAR